MDKSTEPGVYDIITIGSSTMDVFAKSEADLISIRRDDSQEDLIAFPLGAKILIKDLNFESGGGGTNTAVAFSRLGFKTAYLGALGNDENGHQVLDILKKENVDFIGHIVNDRTNFSVILDSMEEDRTVLTYKGASSKLSLKQSEIKKIRAKWIYSASVIKTSFKTLEKIAVHAKKNKIKLAFNPSSYQAKKGKRYLRKILKKCTVLILNRDEAELIVGKGDLDITYQKLSNLGPEIISITEGRQGASCLFKGNIYHAYPKKVKICETTGAGDAFSSGFVAGLILKNDPLFAIKLGMSNAESVIKYFGAKNILLHRKDALKLVEKDDRLVETRKLR